MSFVDIVAWVFGIGAMVSLFVSYQRKDRRGLLFGKLGADVCWAVHYLCLGAYSGMVPNLVGIVREIIFSKKETCAWARKRFWLPLFVVINWLVAYLFNGSLLWTEPIRLIPIAASTFVSLALWLNRTNLTKLICVPVSAAFIVYDLLIPKPSYIGVVNEAAAIASILIYFIANAVKRRKGEEA